MKTCIKCQDYDRKESFCRKYKFFIARDLARRDRVCEDFEEVN